MVDVLNVASTGIYMKLVLIVNFKWNACKNERHRWNYLLFWAQCRYTEIVQRLFKFGDIQYISLTPNKILNSLVYRTLFMSAYAGVTNFQKTVRFFGPLCTLVATESQNSLQDSSYDIQRSHYTTAVLLVWITSTSPAGPSTTIKSTQSAEHKSYLYCFSPIELFAMLLRQCGTLCRCT